MENLGDRNRDGQLLEHALLDPDTTGPTSAIIADPPQDDQMSLETALAAAVVLGALVTWLQTRVDIKVRRKYGQTEFEFRLTKSPSAPATVGRLTEIVAGFFGGPGGTGGQPPP